ncbi:MAG: universal stress protein [Burkholderiaceae bacterium]|nr:universal stress protein [Burkholderiaceae bacterium]
MKILLAIDGSTYTKRMLAYVAAHDEWLGARHQYTVLSVVPFMPPRAAAVTARGAIQRYYRDEAERVLKPIRTFFKKQGLEAEFVGQAGNVADTIAKLADSGGFDLLVMGSHGHGNLGNLVMGSVATKVMATSKLPVLLVR